jgi:methylmalonyl-CoA/ethylmalonyl-CoA epimerase
MIKKIDHIGIVVRDLEASLKVYTEAFGMKIVKREQLTTMDVEVAFLEVGDTLIELLAPTGPNSGMIGESLEENGEGFHHIALRVDNVLEAMKKASESNVELRDKEPWPGADNSTIAFLEPASTQNVLTEFVERDYEVGQK